MPSPLQPNEFLDDLAAEHRAWLSAFDVRYTRNWERLVRADYEPAMTEASVRRLLVGFGLTVEPNEDLTGAEQRPDFKCASGEDGFYVEVTSVSIEKATAETGIDPDKTGLSGYRPMNDAVFHACKGKAAQCAGADRPTLVAIGTFHSLAAAVSFKRPCVNMLLTGETKLTWNIDVRTGQQAGDTYNTTELRSATFLRPLASQEIGFARSSVSALLLCGVGMLPPIVRGILHPNPNYPFNPLALPQVDFAKVELDRESRQLRVDWLDGERQPSIEKVFR